MNIKNHILGKLKIYLLLFMALNLLIVSFIFIIIHQNDPKFVNSINYRDSSIDLETSSQQVKINVIWNQTYGGEFIDTAQSLSLSNLGGYVISGWTNSSGAGDLDIWLLKIDDDGNHLWNKTLGTVEEDKAFEIINCSSGGFAVAAKVRNMTHTHPNNEVSVIRIADNSNIIFHNNYSGPDQNSTHAKDDRGYSIVECPNGDFVIAGVTGTNAGASDVYLLRIGPNGLVKWERTFHHWDNERCFSPHSLVHCSDNGFAIAGYSYSAALSNDVWLIRTDPFGIALWNMTYGLSSGYERPESLVQCKDGGFGIMANTQSFGAGGTDGWFIRTDALGNQIWNQTYGGTEEDSFTKAVMMSDGGFTLMGSTHSFDIGGGDAWIIRIDSDGEVLWEETIGDPYGNGVSSFLFLGNNTYIAAGSTYSIGSIYQDLWVFKFQVIIRETNISPNGTIPIFGIWFFIVTLSTILFIFKKIKKESIRT
jgi:predicted secreted protein